jgi:hypothetical protein
MSEDEKTYSLSTEEYDIETDTWYERMTLSFITLKII